MKVKMWKLFFITFFISCTSSRTNLSKEIDSILNIKKAIPFNGVILINKDGKNIYSKSIGYSSFESKTKFNSKSQFVIGSISKQFTAILVLQEFDKGNLELDVPIKKYLPESNQKWASKVTVRHLLSHMHGIVTLNEDTIFEPGTKYEYSQIGYDLLAKIVEKTSKKSFADLSFDLFQKCKMFDTFHPDFKKHKNLVFGYTSKDNAKLEIENKTFENYVAAGCFISTADDLLQWNNLLYNGKLLSKGAFKLLITKQNGAIRNHPLFGKTAYGLGITIDTRDEIIQYGQTGFAPGFVSVNFYYPKTKTSFIILQNVVESSNDLNKSFDYITKIHTLLRKDIK